MLYLRMKHKQLALFCFFIAVRYCLTLFEFGLHHGSHRFPDVGRTQRTTIFGSVRHTPIKRFVLWLHIPKTGTSFANTLIRWGCPNATEGDFVIPRESSDALSVSFNATMTWNWLSRAPHGRKWLYNHCRHRLSATPSSSSARHPLFSFNIHRPMKRSEAHLTVALS